METGPRYKDVATLRQEVTAKDKSDCLRMELEEAVGRIQEKYRTTEQAARAYVRYLKGLSQPEDRPASAAVERLHKVWNDELGRWEDGPLAS